MKKINLLDIIENKDVLLTFQEAIELNRRKTETGFLVQIKNDLNQIKVNKPIVGLWKIIDLDEVHRASYCCLPHGEKGEGFYLERNYYNLIHFHMHPPCTHSNYSKRDLETFYLARKTNIRKAKQTGKEFFINPLFIIGNKNYKRSKKEMIDLCLYQFRDNEEKLKPYQYSIYINTFEELKNRENRSLLDDISNYLIEPIKK